MLPGGDGGGSSSSSSSDSGSGAAGGGNAGGGDGHTRAPDAAGAPALRAEGVSKRFQSGKRLVQALAGFSAEVRRGTVTGLVGPDGAGKSTLMRLASGLLVPEGGRLSVLGIDVLRDPLRVQSAIGYMPQRFGLYEDLTAQENLDLYADLQGVRPGERSARYAALMRMTGLAPFAGRLAGDLSGGMKQKLGLACTLLRPPGLLLLDEPTAGVDPVSRRELWRIVYRLVLEEGMTVLLSTSYLDEAERCEEVILIHEGKLVEQGSPRSFTERVRGRCFRVLAEGMGKRTLQERLASAPTVADAIVQGGGVRVVMQESGRPGLQAMLAEHVQAENVRIAEIEPRFEDSFIFILKGNREAASAPAAAVAPPTGGAGEEAGEEAGGRRHRDDGRRQRGRGGEVIVVRDVKRRFGRFYAVKGVSFTVQQGEVFGLLGANGAGKSTTFRMLCGLLPPSEGTLRVAGEDLRRAAAKARARIGYMAQRFSLYANLSVMDNLRFFSSAYGLHGAVQRARLAWALDEFGLSPFADAASGQLPLGHKQRLALAAALMHRPEILFLDEPTSGVDPLARREFWLRINRLASQGVTVLVTTHFMEEAEYCDRMAIMSQGEILAAGTPEEMKERSRTPDRPEPSMEDAFIALIERHEQAGGEVP